MKKNAVSFFYESISKGRRIRVAKIEALKHEKVVLYMPNYFRHIKRRHPEIKLRTIVSTLQEPDVIYRKSRSSEEFYYQKSIGVDEYRVVIAPSDYSRKVVITSYRIDVDGILNYIDDEQSKKWRMVYCSHSYEVAAERSERDEWYQNIKSKYHGLPDGAEAIILEWLEEWKSETEPAAWKELAEAEDLFDFRFSLGMYICNQYLWKAPEMVWKLGGSETDHVSYIILFIWRKELRRQLALV